MKSSLAWHPETYDPARVQWSLTFYNVQLGEAEDITRLLTEGWEPFAVTTDEIWFRRQEIRA